MKRLLFFFFSFAVFSAGNAQVDNDFTIEFPRQNPMSPVAAQYMRYGEIPVSLSTGVPEISIPIYTIEANGLEIPINISYHASGIKVADLAGPVGLGWVLNAGGMISQQVRRYTDTGTEHTDTASVEMFPYKTRSEVLAQWESDHQFTTNSTRREIPSTFFSYQNGAGGAHENTISDRFSYNFNGHVGTFMQDITQNGRAFVTAPHEPLKIEYWNIGGTSHFAITDTQGRQWLFKQLGMTGTVKDSPREYYLVSVSFPGMEDRVEFEYEEGVRYFQSYYTESIFNGKRYDIPEEITSFSPVVYNWYQYERITKNADVLHTSAFVKKISWKELSVEFAYDSLSTTSPPVNIIPRRLTAVFVKHGGNLESTTNLYNTEYLETTSPQRRRLLTRIDVNGDRYDFEYNRMPLPHAEMLKLDQHGESWNVYQDFWGYYNGERGGRLIPFYHIWSGGLNQKQSQIPLSGPDPIAGILSSRAYYPWRESDPNYTQAGILTEITYPTRGRTEFVYEQNRGPNVYNFPSNGVQAGRVSAGEDYFGGVRIKQILNYADPNDTTPVETKMYEYEGGTTEPLQERHLSRAQQYSYWKKQLVLSLDDRVIGGQFVYRKANAELYSMSSATPLWQQGEQPLFYNQVTEYRGAPAGANGKTVYSFVKVSATPSPNNPDYMTQSPYQLYDRGLVRHLMARKVDYENVGGTFVRRRDEHNHYRFANEAEVIVGVDILHASEYIPQLNTDMFYDNTDYEYSDFVDDYYRVNNDDNGLLINEMYAQTGVPVLDSVVVKEYPAGGGEIVTTTSYEYDPLYRLLSPIETTTTASNGHLLSTSVTGSMSKWRQKTSFRPSSPEPPGTLRPTPTSRRLKTPTRRKGPAMCRTRCVWASMPAIWTSGSPITPTTATAIRSISPRTGPPTWFISGVTRANFPSPRSRMPLFPR